MKTKIFLVFSNIILLSLLLVSWNGKENLKKTNETVQDSCNTVGLSIINQSTAITLANNYYKSLPRSLKGNSGSDFEMNDSRSVWFSYGELNKFINLVKCKYKQLPINDSSFNKLGVRIYFGRYSNLLKNRGNEDLRDLPNSYQNKHCLFFVPTIKIEVNNKSYNQDLKSINVNTAFKSFDNTTWLVGTNKNHGNISPPDELIGTEYTTSP